MLSIFRRTEKNRTKGSVENLRSSYGKGTNRFRALQLEQLEDRTLLALDSLVLGGTTYNSAALAQDITGSDFSWDYSEQRLTLGQGNTSYIDGVVRVTFNADVVESNDAYTMTLDLGASSLHHIINAGTGAEGLYAANGKLILTGAGALTVYGGIFAAGNADSNASTKNIDASGLTGTLSYGDTVITDYADNYDDLRSIINDAAIDSSHVILVTNDLVRLASSTAITVKAQTEVTLLSSGNWTFSARNTLSDSYAAYNDAKGSFITVFNGGTGSASNVNTSAVLNLGTAIRYGGATLTFDGMYYVSVNGVLRTYRTSSASGNASLIHNNGTLNMYDGFILTNNYNNHATGHPADTAGGVYVAGPNTANGSSYTLQVDANGNPIGSSIQPYVNNPSYSGTDYSTQTAVFNMYGGTVSNNFSAGGAGVKNYGVFYLMGGSIQDNRTVDSVASEAAGVLSRGYVFMSGGTISGNICLNGNSDGGKGGGFHNSNGAYFKMTGGAITNNQAERGGGLYLGGNGYSTAIFEGGEITSNYAVGKYNGTTFLGDGGGFWSNSSVSLYGTTIAYNTTLENRGNGIFIRVADSSTYIDPIITIGGAGAVSTTNEVFIATLYRGKSTTQNPLIPIRVESALTTPGSVMLIRVNEGASNFVVPNLPLIEFAAGLSVQSNKFTLDSTTYELSKSRNDNDWWTANMSATKGSLPTGSVYANTVIFNNLTDSSNYHIRIGDMFFETANAAFAWLTTVYANPDVTLTVGVNITQYMYDLCHGRSSTDGYGFSESNPLTMYSIHNSTLSEGAVVGSGGNFHLRIVSESDATKAAMAGTYLPGSTTDTFGTETGGNYSAIHSSGGTMTLNALTANSYTWESFGDYAWARYHAAIVPEGEDSYFTVKAGSTLTIGDGYGSCIINGNYQYASSSVMFEVAGVMTVSPNVTLKNNRNSSTAVTSMAGHIGGIAVVDSGTLYLYGTVGNNAGTLTGGIGVLSSTANVYIYGGSIEENDSAQVNSVNGQVEAYTNVGGIWNAGGNLTAAGRTVFKLDDGTIVYTVSQTNQFNEGDTFVGTDGATYSIIAKTAVGSFYSYAIALASDTATRVGTGTESANGGNIVAPRTAAGTMSGASMFENNKVTWFYNNAGDYIGSARKAAAAGDTYTFYDYATEEEITYTVSAVSGSNVTLTVGGVASGSGEICDVTYTEWGEGGTITMDQSVWFYNGQTALGCVNGDIAAGTVFTGFDGTSYTVALSGESYTCSNGSIAGTGTVYEADITGNVGVYGGVYNLGTFNMYDGVITDNANAHSLLSIEADTVNADLYSTAYDSAAGTVTMFTDGTINLYDAAGNVLTLNYAHGTATSGATDLTATFLFSDGTTKTCKATGYNIVYHTSGMSCLTLTGVTECGLASGDDPSSVEMTLAASMSVNKRTGQDTSSDEFILEGSSASSGASVTATTIVDTVQCYEITIPGLTGQVTNDDPDRLTDNYSMEDTLSGAAVSSYYDMDGTVSDGTNTYRFSNADLTYTWDDALGYATAHLFVLSADTEVPTDFVFGANTVITMYKENSVVDNIGVWQEGTFNLGATAVIDQSNAVFLNNGHVLTVVENLDLDGAWAGNRLVVDSSSMEKGTVIIRVNTDGNSTYTQAEIDEATAIMASGLVDHFRTDYVIQDVDNTGSPNGQIILSAARLTYSANFAAGVGETVSGTTTFTLTDGPTVIFTTTDAISVGYEFTGTDSRTYVVTSQSGSDWIFTELSADDQYYSGEQSVTTALYAATGLAVRTGNIHYQFIGWNTKADGTGDWYFPSDAELNKIRLNLTATMLYAQWTTNIINTLDDVVDVNDTFRSLREAIIIAEYSNVENDWFIAFDADYTKWEQYKVSVESVVNNLSGQEWTYQYIDKMTIKLTKTLSSNTVTDINAVMNVYLGEANWVDLTAGNDMTAIDSKITIDANPLVTSNISGTGLTASAGTIFTNEQGRVIGWVNSVVTVSGTCPFYTSDGTGASYYVVLTENSGYTLWTDSAQTTQLSAGTIATFDTAQTLFFYAADTLMTAPFFVYDGTVSDGQSLTMGASTCAITVDGGGAISFSGTNTVHRSFILDAGTVSESNFRHFDINVAADAATNPVAFASLTFINGQEANGGAMRIQAGNVTIDSCTFIDNVAVRTGSSGGAGGSIYISGGSLSIESLDAADAELQTVFKNENLAVGAYNAYNGGAIFNRAVCTIDSALMTGLSVSKSGGALYNGSASAMSEMTVTRSEISSNTAEYYGGGICNYGALDISDRTVISSNTAKMNGGGVCNGYNLVNSQQSSLTISNYVTLSNNSATGANQVSTERTGFGGGILNASAATLSGVFLIGNTASNNGGGISNSAYKTYYSDEAGESGGNLTIFDDASGLFNVIQNNAAGYCGGGIGSWGILDLSGHTSLLNNTAPFGKDLYVYNDKNAKFVIGGSLSQGVQQMMSVIDATAGNGQTIDFGDTASLDGDTVLFVDKTGDGEYERIGALETVTASTLGLQAGEYTLACKFVTVDGVESTQTTVRLTVTADTPTMRLDGTYAVMRDSNLYLSVENPDDSLRYFWDIDGDGVYEERACGFWVATSSLNFDSGEAVLRMQAIAVDGTMVATDSAVISLIQDAPSVTLYHSELLDGRILRLTLETPGRVIESWTVSWGDGASTAVDNVVSTLSTAHYYAPGESDTEYAVTLQLTDADGCAYQYFLMNHFVAGTGGALAEVAVETGAENAAITNLTVAKAADVPVRTDETAADALFERQTVFDELSLPLAVAQDDALRLAVHAAAVVSERSVDADDLAMAEFLTDPESVEWINDGLLFDDDAPINDDASNDEEKPNDSYGGELDDTLSSVWA